MKIKQQRTPHNEAFAKAVAGTSKGKTMVQRFEEMLVTSCYIEKNIGKSRYFSHEYKAYPLATEYEFTIEKGWRFDYAYPENKIAFEIDGGVYTQGRHTRAQGFINDCTKINNAQKLGWKVYRIAAPEHIEFAREVIKGLINGETI